MFNKDDLLKLKDDLQQGYESKVSIEDWIGEDKLKTLQTENIRNSNEHWLIKTHKIYRVKFG